MGMVVVTGMGPRTGTSFVMQQAIAKGFPVVGHQFLEGLTVPKHNIHGYWDCYPGEIEHHLTTTGLDKQIVKIWYPILKDLNTTCIDRILVIERQDKEQQLKSMYKVWEDESKLPLIKAANIDIDLPTLLEEHTKGLKQLLKDIKNKMIVFTEDLDKEIDVILDFLKGGL
jgi:hypothetical protein